VGFRSGATQSLRLSLCEENLWELWPLELQAPFCSNWQAKVVHQVDIEAPPGWVMAAMTLDQKRAKPIKMQSCVIQDDFTNPEKEERKKTNSMRHGGCQFSFPKTQCHHQFLSPKVESRNNLTT
jgi:hypothetical protein